MGANNALNNMTGTALVTNKAASTTYTLTAASQNFQLFTNSGFVSGALVQLPVTSTLMIGRTFTIFNYDPFVTMVVNSSGGNLIATIPTNAYYTFTMVDPTLTTAAGWMASGQAPQVKTASSTPTITFATPGNLSVSYSSVSASLWVTGNLAFLKVFLRFTPTYTSASGNFIIQNLPAGMGNVSAEGIGGVININGNAGLGITPVAYPASCTSFVPVYIDNFGSPIINLYGMGNAVATAPLTITQFPTATAKYFGFTIAGWAA